MLDFGKLELKSFGKPKVGQLKIFVQVRLTSNLTELKKKEKLIPNKNFPNKGITELASFGDFNLISQAFELRKESSAFGIVDLQAIESTSEEITPNLGPIDVEVSLIKKICLEKSLKLLSNQRLIEKHRS